MGPESVQLAGAPILNQAQISTLIRVNVRSNESLDAALRRFKRQCNQAGIFVAMKDRTFYTKPTWARTEAKEERRRVIKRAERIRRNACF